MTAKQLSEVGERLVRRCGTRDPFEIARQLGVEVLFCPDFGSMKGMCSEAQSTPRLPAGSSRRQASP